MEDPVVITLTDDEIDELLERERREAYAALLEENSYEAAARLYFAHVYLAQRARR